MGKCALHLFRIHILRQPKFTDDTLIIKFEFNEKNKKSTCYQPSQWAYCRQLKPNLEDWNLNNWKIRIPPNLWPLNRLHSIWPTEFHWQKNGVCRMWTSLLNFKFGFDLDINIYGLFKNLSGKNTYFFKGPNGHLKTKKYN